MPVDASARGAVAALSPIERVISAAESAVGINYAWGGNSLASGVDCSGLVQQAFRNAGIELPRVSAVQAQQGQAVGLDQMQPGDLIWWDNSSRNNGADHIAIYVGNGLMIEAARRGTQVRVVPVQGRNPTGARRVLGVVSPTGPAGGVPLGPNATRTYTKAASTGTAAPPTEVPADTATDGGIGDDLPPDSTPEQIEAYIRKNYQDVAWLLTNPEIRTVLLRDDIDDLDTREIQSLVEATDYWKTHSERSRQFDYLLATNKAEAVRQIELGKDAIGDEAQRLGVAIDDAELGELAKRAIRSGWTPEQITEILTGRLASPAEMRGGVFIDKQTGRPAYYGPDGEAGTASRAELDAVAKPGDVIKSRVMPDGRTAWYIEGKNVADAAALPAGEASNSADSLMARARQYLVPISRSDAEGWALDIMNGKATPESFQSWLTNLAKAEYANRPDLLAALEGGATPSQFFTSHTRTVEDILELGDGTVDLMDPKWSWITGVPDGKGGVRTPTRGEVAMQARERPEYAGTRAYQSTSADYALGLAKFTGTAA